MKAKPLPFEEFRGNGVLDFSSATDLLLRHQPPPQKWNTYKDNCYVGTEPTSVLDSRRSPSSPTSTSTLSSSLGASGGNGSAGSTDTTVAVAAAVSENPPVLEKCGAGMEDWESVLSESPGQEQSILRLIMGDIEDPSLGLNKLLQSENDSLQHHLEFNGLGLVDQGFVFEPKTAASDLLSTNIETSLPEPPCSDFQFYDQNVQSNNNLRLVSVSNTNPMFSASAANRLPVSLNSGAFQHHQQQQQQLADTVDEKPQISDPQVMINQNQVQFTQNPAVFMPLTYAHLQEHQLLSPPPAKRLNSGAFGPNFTAPKIPFAGSGQDLFVRRQIDQQNLQQIQLPPHLLQQRPTTVAVAKQHVQQEIIDQLFKAAELIESGNSVLAQEILARLNHQLSPIGKPFHRASFYFKEALQLLLHINTSHSSNLSPFSLIFKIGAYKSFSEISPVLQFANFTCNQVLLEAVGGFHRIHIIDFDIGYGGQWASFMQELALRNGDAQFFKITAFVSPSTHDEFELGFTQDNLTRFASDLNIAFELEIVSLESFNSGSWPVSLHILEREAIAVNLPVCSISTYPSTLLSVLRFIKQLSPKIVVSLDRCCDGTDASFPHYFINSLQYFSGLLESLDAVNMNLDAQQKIERYLLLPSIEKIVLGRHRSPERLPPWRNLFLSSGFSPLSFSNFTESQAECLVQRTPVRGFHIERRQTSLVLCWQRKELLSASAWRC